MVQSELSGRIERALDGSDVSVAVAESLTGGSLSAALARIRGSGAWYRGGVVAYSRAVKHEVLAVPPGPVVSGEAAAAMAEAAAPLLGATVTIAVTGVAGPDEQDGEPPGTVWMAVHSGGRTTTSLLHLSGSPEEIVEQTCSSGLACLAETVEDLVRG